MLKNLRLETIKINVTLGVICFLDIGKLIIKMTFLVKSLHGNTQLDRQLVFTMQTPLLYNLTNITLQVPDLHTFKGICGQPVYLFSTRSLYSCCFLAALHLYQHIYISKGNTECNTHGNQFCYHVINGVKSAYQYRIAMVM